MFSEGKTTFRIPQGFRGPNFEGTDTCDIITVADRRQIDMHEQVNLVCLKYRIEQGRER